LVRWLEEKEGKVWHIGKGMQGEDIKEEVKLTLKFASC
jgi:hypothetical protein